MSRLLTAALLLSIGFAAGSCSGAMVADHLPVWAGGEPDGVPPRPGTPAYEEYRRKLKQATSQDADKSQAAEQQSPAGREQKN